MSVSGNVDLLKALTDRAIGEGLNRLPIVIGQIVAKDSPAAADAVAKAADALLSLAEPHIEALIEAGGEWLRVVLTDVQKAIHGDDYPAHVTVGTLIIDDEEA